MKGRLSAEKWLENLARGRSRDPVQHGPHQSREFRSIEHLALAGIQVVSAEEGRIQCTFVVPERLTDTEGNWHAGAIAALIDAVGTAVVVSYVKQIPVSVNFEISFFSTAKINEEVEIDGKVIGQNEKASAMYVEIRKKGKGGELIALGKQWMVSLPDKLKRSRL